MNENENGEHTCTVVPRLTGDLKKTCQHFSLHHISFMRKFYVYILASKKDGVLYTGFTSNLPSRIEAHKQHINKGFTDKYQVTKLVYVEQFDKALEAIRREKQIKHWKREWREQLIESINPEWEDLYEKADYHF